MEGCYSVGITEKLIEGAKAAPSLPRLRPALHVTTPSKGGQEGTPLLRELGCKADGAYQPRPQGAGGWGKQCKEGTFIPENP